MKNGTEDLKSDITYMRGLVDGLNRLCKGLDMVNIDAYCVHLTCNLSMLADKIDSYDILEKKE